MNRFETDRKNFWLLPVSIIIGIGCGYYGIKDFEFKLQSVALLCGGIFMAIGIPIYALLYQKKIEINHKEKFVEIFYPVLNKRIHLRYEQVDKIRILKNINASQGMTYDEITIFSKEHKVRMKSNEFTFFDSLENKLKHEFKDKIEIL
jgi:hypothetical protein